MKIDKPEQVLAMQMLNTYMKSAAGAAGDNNNFDLIMQAMMDSITSDNTDPTIENMLNSFTSSITNSSSASNTLLDEETRGSSDDSNLNLDMLNYNSLINKNSSSLGSGNNDARINAAVSKASKQFGVDESLVKAIIKNESNYNPKAVSSAGAMGLMQLMPANCRAAGVTDPFNIEQNVYAGTKQIKDCLKLYNGNVEMALMAYNAGQGTVQRRGVTSVRDLYKMPSETQNYVVKVMNSYKNLIY